MPKKYILKSFAPGSPKNNKTGFSNLFNLSKIGIDWNTSIIKSSLALGVNETNTGADSLYGGYEEDSRYARMSDITNAVGEYVAFFDKSYPVRREYLRSFALNGEIGFVLDTIADEAIVQDENNFFAYPDIDQLKAKMKPSEEAKEVVSIINESFRKVYQLYGWSESNDAWHYFKKFLVDGFLAFEIIYKYDGYRAVDIIGFKELDPITLEPSIERDEEGNELKIWYQYKGDAERQRRIPDANIIYISWAKGHFPSRISYLESLTRSFNMLRQLENSRIIWNVQNAQKRIKMVVPIGSQNEDRAKTRLRELQAYYNEDVNIDDYSGEMVVNGQSKFSFAKTYMFPSKEGTQTEISELGVEGYDLNSVETLKYFWRRFIIETKIPANRFSLDLNSQQSVPMNGEASITREEYAFARFVYRIQSVFQELLTKPIWMLFCIKKPAYASNDLIRSCIGILYNDENLFTLSKERSIANDGAMTIQTLQAIQDANGKPYFSTRFLVEKYLGLTNDDIELNISYKTKDKIDEVKSGKDQMDNDMGGFGGPSGGFGNDFGGMDNGPADIPMDNEPEPSAEISQEQ